MYPITANIHDNTFRLSHNGVDNKKNELIVHNDE
jgi:hypothetical protein